MEDGYELMLRVCQCWNNTQRRARCGNSHLQVFEMANMLKYEGHKYHNFSTSKIPDLYKHLLWKIKLH